MCVVPRRILHNESNNEVIAVAVLDTYSQGIFSTDDLMKKLDNHGTKISINIKALTGDEKQPSHTSEWISVSKMSTAENEIQKWMKLPPPYLRTETPVDKSEIATPGKLKQSKYLKQYQKLLEKMMIQVGTC